MNEEEILEALADIGKNWDFQHENILLRNPDLSDNDLKQTEWDQQFEDLIFKLSRESYKILNEER